MGQSCGAAVWVAKVGLPVEVLEASIAKLAPAGDYTVEIFERATPPATCVTANVDGCPGLEADFDVFTRLARGLARALDTRTWVVEATFGTAVWASTIAFGRDGAVRWKHQGPDSEHDDAALDAGYRKLMAEAYRQRQPRDLLHWGLTPAFELSGVKGWRKRGDFHRATVQALREGRCFEREQSTVRITASGPVLTVTRSTSSGPAKTVTTSTRDTWAARTRAAALEQQLLGDGFSRQPTPAEVEATRLAQAQAAEARARQQATAAAEAVAHARAVEQWKAAEATRRAEQEAADRVLLDRTLVLGEPVESQLPAALLKVVTRLASRYGADPRWVLQAALVEATPWTFPPGALVAVPGLKPEPAEVVVSAELRQRLDRSVLNRPDGTRASFDELVRVALSVGLDALTESLREDERKRKKLARK